MPNRRLICRRQLQDRRTSLRWDLAGGDRRQGFGRRNEDEWDAVKAELSRRAGIHLPFNNTSGPVFKLSHAFLFCAVGATEKSAAFPKAPLPVSRKRVRE
jgi:hypothetical protein